MNPRDDSPIDHCVTHFLGTPFSEWMDVKLLADEEDVSIRGLVKQYRLFRHRERHRARILSAVNKVMISDGATDREIEATRESLLEKRVASLERRLARLDSLSRWRWA